MLRHTRVFLKSRNLWPKVGVPTEPPPNLLCEWCFKVPLADVHHIEEKGMGGRANADAEDNLIGLCLNCHDAAHGIGFQQIDKEKLKERVRLILETIHAP